MLRTGMPTELDEFCKTELINAAIAIEEATRALTQVAKRHILMNHTVPPSPEEQIKATILDSTKAVLMATSALLNGGFELAMEHTKLLENPRRDPNWAGSLISATRNIGPAFTELVQVVKEAVEGNPEEEPLMNKLKVVAVASSRLCFCLRGKYSLNNETMGNLTLAAKTTSATLSTLAKNIKDIQDIHHHCEAREDASTRQRIKMLEEQLGRAQSLIQKARYQRDQDNHHGVSGTNSDSASPNLPEDSSHFHN